MATCPTLPNAVPPASPTPPRPNGGAHLVLQPGHWDWADEAYAWVPPTWVPRPRPHAEKSGRIWQDGAWTADGIACVWHSGHFLF